MNKLKTQFILLMGVSGCGKTTVGRALSVRLGWVFYDADDYHSPENIAKMRNGVPLTDADRLPWLRNLHEIILSHIKENKPGIMACSALKERYRKILLTDCKDNLLVYLEGNYDLIWSRMISRPGHYMKPEMLKSQFDALEEPVGGLKVDISKPVEDIVESILEYIVRGLSR